MKNLNLTGILCLFIMLGLSSCSEKQLEGLSTTKEIITKGEWSVDYYFSGQDRTSQFHDYAFHFNTDGTVMAVHGADTVSGSWKTMRDAGYKDILVITVNQSQLADLNTNWNVTTLSLNSIAMKDEANTQLRFHKL